MSKFDTSFFVIGTEFQNTIIKFTDFVYDVHLTLDMLYNNTYNNLIMIFMPNITFLLCRFLRLLRIAAIYNLKT